MPDPAQAAVIDQLLDSTISRLDELSEDELLTLIGTGDLAPIEYTTVAIHAYAPEQVPDLERRELILPPVAPLSLPGRGRRTVDRIMRDWRDELRDRVCPLWKKGANLVDLAKNIAVALTALVAFLWVHILAAIAVFIAKYLIDELCKDF